MSKKISCVIPAYNEGPRIESVLRAVHNHPLISEIIVVDDSSSDNTAELVRKFEGVNLIVLEKNMGKSRAVATGVKRASHDLLFLLDADLVGLDENAISRLIEPVVSGQADVGISLRINSPGIWRTIGLDYISGERVFPRSLIAEHLGEIEKLPRFGLESFMNKLIIRNKHRIKVVRWNGVKSPYKYKKRGLARGVRDEILMIYDIFRTISPWEAARQILAMSFLKVD